MSRSNLTLFRAAYIAMPLYLCGFIVLGAAVQKKLSVGALVMGWGLAEVAVMINTVAVCEFDSSSEASFDSHYLDAYCNDCFPRHKASRDAVCDVHMLIFSRGRSLL